jgi:hypothetical protein
MSLTLSLDGGRVSQDRNVRLEHGAAYLDNLAVGPASVTAILHTSSATYNTTMPVQIDADSDSTLDLAFDTTTGIRIVDGSRVPAALPISIIESPLDSSPFPSRYAFQVSFTGSAYGLVPGEYRLRYYVPTQGGRFSYETDYVEWSVDVVAGHVVEVVPPAS